MLTSAQTGSVNTKEYASKGVFKASCIIHHPVLPVKHPLSSLPPLGMARPYLQRAFAVTALLSVAVAVDISTVAPTVTLDQGTFVGIGNGNVSRFLGIPFAKPPYVSSI